MFVAQYVTGAAILLAACWVVFFLILWGADAWRPHPLWQVKPISAGEAALVATVYTFAVALVLAAFLGLTILATTFGA